MTVTDTLAMLHQNMVSILANICLRQTQLWLFVYDLILIQNTASIRWMGLLKGMSVDGGSGQALTHIGQIMRFEPSKLKEMLTAIKQGKVSHNKCVWDALICTHIS